MNEKTNLTSELQKDKEDEQLNKSPQVIDNNITNKISNNIQTDNINNIDNLNNNNSEVKVEEQLQTNSNTNNNNNSNIWYLDNQTSPQQPIPQPIPQQPTRSFKSSLSSFLTSYTPNKIDSSLLYSFKNSLSTITNNIPSSITSPISTIASPITSGINILSYLSNSIPFPINYSRGVVNNSNNNSSNSNNQDSNVNSKDNKSQGNIKMVAQHQSNSTTNSTISSPPHSTFSSLSSMMKPSITHQTTTSTGNVYNNIGTEEQYIDILHRLEMAEFNYLSITLNSFVDNINNDNQQSVQDISSSVSSFIQTTLPMMMHACASVPFKSPSSTIQSRAPCVPSLIGKSLVELETIIYEFMEQYITSRLYRRIFSSSEGIQKDTSLCEHISKFQSITPSNLDISDSMISDSQFLEQIQEELLHMTAYKSPRDKLICIKKSFTLLFKLLSKSQVPIGADLLLPIIIYCLIKSNLPFLYSNLQYISLFRNPNFIEPETNYYLVTLITATSFIQDMTFESLTDAIDPSKVNNNSNSDNEQQHNVNNQPILKSTQQHEDIKSNTTTSINKTNNLDHQLKQPNVNNNNTKDSSKSSTIENPFQTKKKKWKFYQTSPEELSIKDIKSMISDFNQLVDYWYEHRDENN